MSETICYMCDNNFPYKEYEGTELLDPNGNKPCFDCLSEAGVFEEKEIEEDLE